MGAGRKEDKERKKREKEREKERKKRGAGKYGQVKLKNARMGIYSCVYAGGTFVLIGLCIAVAFVMREKTWGIVGGIGILSIVLSILGIRAAVKGMREREKNYITCKIGLACNILILLCLLVIFLGGVL